MINSHSDFVLLACDGIFDKMSNQDCVDAIWKNVRAKKQESVHAQVGPGVDVILKTAALKRTLDNITAVIIALDGLASVFRPESVATEEMKENVKIKTGTSRNMNADLVGTNKEMNSARQMKMEQPLTERLSSLNS